MIEKSLEDYFDGRGEFCGLGLDRVAASYVWDLPASTERYVQLEPDQGSYARNVALKRALSRIWAEAPGRRDEITRWIIADWGRITRNAEATLIGHRKRAEADRPETPLKGIASFSKVLAIRDPDRFAIYDARVAVSLMAVQFLAGSSSGRIFPYLAGRNKVTGHQGKKIGFAARPEFSPSALQARHKGWTIVPKSDAYANYVELLRALSKKREQPLYALEMALFSDAEKLALQCCQKLGAAGGN